MRFEIPIEPVTKKNSQQIARAKNGRPFIVPSATYKKYQREAAPFVPKGIITGPVEVSAKFFRRTRRRVDLTNCLEALDDLLVFTGLLPDDSCEVIVSHDGSRVFYDKENPRTEVEIRPFCV